MIAIGASTWLASSPPRVAATQADPASHWQAANQAYRAGEFSAAAAGYRALLVNHDDPRLEANLAAALWRADERGAALGHYRRALARAPRALAIHADYRRLRAELNDPPDGLTAAGARLAQVRRDELLAALLAVSLATWAAAVTARRARRPRLARLARRLRATGAVGVVVVGALVAAHAWTVGRPDQGVLIRPAALAAAPGGAPFTTLPEGLVAELRGRSGGAWRVRAEGYPAGWVATDLILPLH
ncbi:MAG: hypothetical protein ABR559_03245 [Gemmatimonadota bacterium]